MRFEELYERYFRKVYAFAFSLTHNADAAEELTQETFFKAMRSQDRFKGQSSPTTWLCSIAHNLYVSDVRKHSRLTDDSALEYQAADGDIEEDLQKKDTAMRIHRMLHQLPEPYREVFSLRVFGELSYAEIGTIFGKSESWARVNYFRAKQRLQTSLQEE